MSDDEFDNIPDDFADIQGVDWTQLLSGPSTTPTRHEQPAESSQTVVDPIPNSPLSNGSSLYFPDDDLDAAFLAELDQVEQRVVQESQVASSSRLPHRDVPQVHGTGESTSSAPASGAAVALQPQLQCVSDSRTPHNLTALTWSSPQKRKKTDAESQLKEHIEQGSTLPTKRERSDDDIEIISPKRKGKMKADNEMRQILSSYEDELTCPICFDIFVASHVGNPCGHTFCGDCGWQWHVQNKKKACPFCRIDLAESMPMIPNIAMDNTVEKHIKALASSGVREWEPGGQKFREWDARKQAWHNGMAKREQQKKISRRAYKPPPVIEIFDNHNWLHMFDVDEGNDPDYVDSDDGLVPRPIQRARRRR